MKSIHVLFWFLIVLAVISGCTCENDSVPKRVALVVAIVEEGGATGDRTQHLMKYKFVEGELVSTDTIVSNPGAQLRFNCDESQLYQDRYMITDLGDIVDITTGQFIHRGGSGSAYTQLLGVEEDRVFIHTPQTKEYHYYDLAEQEYRELEDPGKWSLPGLLSPDGTMSVSSSNWDEGTIWLHCIDSDMRQLGAGFYLEYSFLASTISGVPLMWLDNERVLTQKSNGEIFIVKVDGSIEPVVNIDLSQIDSAPSGLSGALHASLYRGSDGTIIYAISLLGPDNKFHDNRFVIDVENEAYLAYDPEWTALGHEFDYASQEDIATIRYDGQEIGQEQYFNAGHVQTMKGHMAITSQESRELNPTAIRVWSSANEKWITIDFESPTWITHSAIIGWLEVD